MSTRTYGATKPTLAETLEYVVENGRVEGSTAQERMESAIEEVKIEIFNQTGFNDDSAVEEFVRRHYKA